MKALPKRVGEPWVKCKCDPSVEYQMRLLPRHVALHIASQNTDIDTTGGEPQVVMKTLWYSYDTLRFALRGLRGLEDPDTGQDFTLHFDRVNIRGNITRAVTCECIDRLPLELFSELSEAAINAGGMTEEEVEQVDFTPTSSAPGNT